jgi:BRCT domain type II-containing protein
VIQPDLAVVINQTEQGQDGRATNPVCTELCMGDLVNLRTERKRSKRRQAERQAASNRLAHGRSKAERAIEQSHNDKSSKTLDQHRIETGDGQ